jgi:RHS repeat-associated protein
VGTSVTVEGAAADRQGAYFRKQVTLNNSSAPVWEEISVSPGGEPNKYVFLPGTPERFDDTATANVNDGYDADGNLLLDGRWTYSWDAENRLVNMVKRFPATDLAKAPNGTTFVKLGFEYDFRGRRIAKNYYATAGGTTPFLTYKFVYDGWNLVAILDGSSALVRSFTWGLDLSGSEQGAGGVGGLLFVRDQSTISSQPSTHFASADGNGNLVALVFAATIGVNEAGMLSASYEYGPFGELIRQTGPMAKANPFRFSTKYQDDETDLLYYGYRYYSTSLGRWLNRDPIEERGGMNLYGFVGNDPIRRIDELGLINPWPEIQPPPPPPPPLREEDLGFEMCRRNALGDGLGTAVANSCCGGAHSFVRQKFLKEDGSTDYRGYGFNDSGGPPFLEGDSLVKPKYSYQVSCAACSKSGNKLQNGTGQGKKGADATDAEIWDCITKTPNSKPYSSLGYNCWSWAKEAASKCGLSCPTPGQLKDQPKL